MSRNKLKILYVSSEVVPFAKTGGLADVAGSLPKEIKKLGVDIRIILPYYSFIDFQKFNIKDLDLSNFSVLLGEFYENGKIKFTKLPVNFDYIPIYFIQNNKFFDRGGLYVNHITNVDYPDNGERFIFFSHAIFETLKKIDWKPDVIHSNDWQTGLVPLYLRSIYKNDLFFKDIKTIFTIHNIAYQGLFQKDLMNLIGLPWDYFSIEGIEFYDRVNFLKAGILYSDLVTTVSPRYAEEICSSVEYGYGLEGVLKSIKSKLIGILNGADYEVWNPMYDKLIPQNYSARSIAKKIINKKALLEKFKIPYVEKMPTIGMVSRLVDQKGFDIIEGAAEDLLKLDLQIIFLGEGEVRYQTFLERIQMHYSDKVGVKIGFSDELAHLIEAGSDIYLMPSRYEPCGLNQIYSMKYGTIPIVRATGGLDDTVEDFNPITNTGTGFKFNEYRSDKLIEIVQRALEVYKDKKTWTKLMKNAMKKDFSWKSSAQKYFHLYKSVL